MEKVSQKNAGQNNVGQILVPNLTEEILTKDEEKRYEELCAMAFDFARNDACENLEIMLNAGLSENLKNHKGDSLLMLASYHNSLPTAQMLLKRGARVDEKNDRGQTPLAGVCFKGYFEMAKLLVESGANIRENNGLGMTPFAYALMFGRKDIAKFFLEYEGAAGERGAKSGADSVSLDSARLDSVGFDSVARDAAKLDSSDLDSASATNANAARIAKATSVKSALKNKLSIFIAACFSALFAPFRMRANQNPNK